jgi:hypothetical protein
MSTTTEEAVATLPILVAETTLKTIGSSSQGRDLKTSIFHADEELYQQQLEARGVKEEDMWQGGDMSAFQIHLCVSRLTCTSSFYPNPPKIAHDVTVEDITGREKDFTLDNSGFILGKQVSKSVVVTDDLNDTEKIKNEYYPEMEAWLKKVYVHHAFYS